MALPENCDTTVCLSHLRLASICPFYETVILRKECVKALRGAKDPVAIAVKEFIARALTIVTP
jgi:hypothetical protein